jgi:transcriptional regulator with GAF, ATPase, and Fis domain
MLHHDPMATGRDEAEGPPSATRNRFDDHGSPNAVALWRALQELVARVGSVVKAEGAIDDGLDIVVELLGADRGFVLMEREDGVTHVVNARGPRRALQGAEREEVSRTILRRALESDAMVVWTASEQPLDTASVLALSIGAAMVAPLRGTGFGRGALYVDFRSPRLELHPGEVEFFRAAVVLLSTMLDEAARSRVVRERLAVAEGHMMQAHAVPPMDEILALDGMRRVRADVELARVGDAPVLVLGESGTGKTFFAQSLAEAIAARPIVRVVLGGSDDLNTIASELFGHERHAFSGAHNKRVGLVEYAHGGTLVLDEVLNLPREAQKLLLDFTQFGTYRPLGYDRPEPKHAAVRVIAVTNGDMRAAVREGRFREDLYYRLAGITISLPPLRERLHDVPALAESLLRRADPARTWSLSLPLRRRLASAGYEWPGNLRELEWCVRRARDRATLRDPNASEVDVVDFSDVFTSHERRPDALPKAAARVTEASSADAWRELQDEKARLEEREVEALVAVLERHRGVVAHAAKELGIARTTLASRVDALGIARRAKS